MKKKWLTFSAGLAGAISCAFLIILSVVTIIQLENLANMLQDYRGYFQDWVFALVILVIIAIVSVVLNCCAINVLTTEKYKKCKATIITAIIFNFIILIYNLVIVIALYIADWLIAINVIIIISLLICNVLYIVDLSLGIKLTDDISVKTNKVSQMSSKANSEEEQLLKQLDKLVSLREQKILTQEEFEKLKSQIISKNIEK